MPDFHEVLFPPLISYGSNGGPKFKNTVFTADSGHEQRDEDWTSIRAEYDVAESIKDNSQMDQLREFFMCRMGRAYGFRYQDWADYTLNGAVIGAGDWGTQTFQLAKTYTSFQTESGESYTYLRPITKPSWGTLAGLTLAGSVLAEVDAGQTQPAEPAFQQTYAVAYNTGLITFRYVPYGPIYSGEATTALATPTATPLDRFSGLIAGGMYGSGGPVPFIQGDSVVTGGQNSTTDAFGIRNFRLSDGAEIGNGTPSATFPTDNISGPTTPTVQTLSSFACRLQDGTCVAQFGGQNGQPLGLVDPVSLTVIAQWGAVQSPFPDGGDVSSVNALWMPGCVSNDGNLFARADFYVLNQLCSVHKSGKDGSPFGTHVTNFPTLNQLPGSFIGLAPYDISDFILCTRSLDAGTQITFYRQDKQVLSLTIAVAGTIIQPYFMLYDESDTTMCFGWTINGQPYISKLDFQTSTEVYRVPVFGIFPGQNTGAPVINGQLVWIFQHETVPGATIDTGYWLAFFNTATGLITARPLPIVTPGSGLSSSSLSATASTYDYVSDKIFNTGNNGAGPIVIDCSTAGCTVTPGQSIQIGYCEFHVPVRFDIDQMEVAQEFWETSTWPKVPLVEVKNWEDVVNPPSALVTFTWAGL